MIWPRQGPQMWRPDTDGELTKESNRVMMDALQITEEELEEFITDVVNLEPSPEGGNAFNVSPQEAYIKRGENPPCDVKFILGMRLRKELRERRVAKNS